MMKVKNKKGITLTELIISIAMISIVIMFLFRLLVDARYSNNNTDFNRENQQTRAIILKTVQKDFLEKKLVGMRVISSNANQIALAFTYASGEIGRFTIGLEGSEQFISYQNNGGTEKWFVKKENSISTYNLRCISFETENIFNNVGGEFYRLKISIPMVVSRENKNFIDDLEFFYIGEKKDLQTDGFSGLNVSHLGAYDANSC